MDSMLHKVEIALDGIRPYLQADGGDVRVIEVLNNDTEVVIEFTGNCKSCPMSEMTFTTGVEETIKRELPQIITVREISASNEERLSHSKDR